MKKPKRKQPFTMPPMDIKGSASSAGKKKSFGHGMGGLFGASAKKTEPDNTPPKRSQVRAARIARLANKRI